jgi:hypothetical protein
MLSSGLMTEPHPGAHTRGGHRRGGGRGIVNHTDHRKAKMPRSRNVTATEAVRLERMGRTGERDHMEGKTVLKLPSRTRGYQSDEAKARYQEDLEAFCEEIKGIRSREGRDPGRALSPPSLTRPTHRDDYRTRATIICPLI